MRHARGIGGRRLALDAVTYQLDFAGAAGRPPAATVTTNICWVDNVAAGGRAQPALSDPSLKSFKAVSQLLPAR